ncbi:MAG: hypothetical protein HYT03_02355 [Candidatus Harrisonbacteria bacterium]|nr:hypothetical protein [Candidatus Harrisonbacteria bacterium]
MRKFGMMTVGLTILLGAGLLLSAAAAPATTDDGGTYVTQIRIFADYDITIGNTAEQSDLKLERNINRWIKANPGFQIQKIDQCPGPYNKFMVQYLERRQTE